ncbi:hypothetical protein FSHL1_006370 [Fusarium sambucinum]
MSEDLEKCNDSQWIQQTTLNAPTVDGDQKLDPVTVQHQDGDIENAPSAQTTVIKVNVSWHALVFMYWLMLLATIAVMEKVYRDLFPMKCKN